jgi:hypothetical protein
MLRQRGQGPVVGEWQQLFVDQRSSPGSSLSSMHFLIATRSVWWYGPPALTHRHSHRDGSSPPGMTATHALIVVPRDAQQSIKAFSRIPFHVDPPLGVSTGKSLELVADWGLSVLR